MTVAQMAGVLNSLPLGTVTHIYLTSDGGGNLNMLYELVASLDSHVEVVNHRALVDLARSSLDYQKKEEGMAQRKSVLETD